MHRWRLPAIGIVSATVVALGGGAGAARRGAARPRALADREPVDPRDGSIFPTSVGATPQLSIYDIVNRLAQGLAQRLARRDATRA